MKQALYSTIALLIALHLSQSSADQLQYLPLPQQALAAFATAINEAKTSIDVATFIYQPCDFSVRVLSDALLAKAQAGVHVRVLLDALQQSDEQLHNLANEFAGAGIEIRIFSTSLLDIDTRLHAKFIVVDGAQYIFGGRNFSDEYFDLATTLNYVDRDLWVSGASAGQAQAAFDSLWNSDMSSAVLGSQDNFVDWNIFCGADLSAGTASVQNYLQQNSSTILQKVQSRSCDIQFAVDDADFANPNYGPKWDNGNGATGFLTYQRRQRKHATHAVLSFISGAQTNLTVENYFYVPITDLEMAFSGLRARGVPVQILTNQDIEEAILAEAEEFDIAQAQASDSVGSEWVGLVSSGGSLSTAFAMTPTGTPFYMHQKVATRDGRDLLIGSFNMDSRSANINVESAGTVTNCPDLVNDMSTNFAVVDSQYQADQTSSTVPPAPTPDIFAKILGDILITEF